MPATESAKVAGAAVTPSTTAESVTEPPAGTEAGGSCTAAAALPELSITEPEPPAEMERTAEGTSTSPALEICTAREILCPTDVRDCAGVPVIESAGGRRAAPDDADADCAAKVRPESALAPERLTVSCTAVPAVCGTTVSVCVELVPAAMASCTSEGVTLPPVAETLSCAPERSTSPSLRAWTVTATGRPTSTTPGNAREASAGAGPLRTVSARRTESAMATQALPSGMPSGGSTWRSFSAYWFTISRWRFWPRPVT